MSYGVFRRRWVPPLRRAFPWSYPTGAALDTTGTITVTGTATISLQSVLATTGAVTVTGTATIKLTAVLAATGVAVTLAGTAVLPAVLAATGVAVAVTGAAGLTVNPLDHWANVREGDVLRLVLPHAGFAGRTVLARVVGRALADGDAHMELELQVIDQTDAQTALRAFGDLGAAGAPPVVIPTDARVTQAYPVIRAQLEELERLMALQALKYP